MSLGLQFYLHKHFYVKETNWDYNPNFPVLIRNFALSKAMDLQLNTEQKDSGLELVFPNTHIE